MVAPGSTGANFDILLQFALDEEANKRVQSRVSTIDEELKRIEQDALKAGKAMNQMATTSAQKTESAQKSVVKLGTELAKLGERAQAGARQTNQALDSNIKKLQQVEEAAKRARQQSAMISGAAARGAAMFGQGLIAGTLVAGGIFAEANRGAKEAEQAGKATRATQEWTRATKELAAARARVDTVLLKEALPLLQEAVKIAEKTADFIEKHPELVQAALKTGVVVAGLSAVGLAVTKGIKLVADTAYIAATATELIAARMHDQAANKELAAAGTKQITNRADDLRNAFGLTKPDAGTRNLVAQTIQIAGAVTLIASSVLIGAEIGNTIGNAIAKLIDPNAKNMTLKETTFFGGVRAVEAIEQKQQGVIGNFLKILSLTEAGDRNIDKIMGKAGGVIQSQDKFFQKLLLGLDNANQKAGQLANTSLSVADSTNRDQLVKAYEDYKSDDLALVQEHYKEREGIVQDALNAELAANKQYADSVAKVNANTAKSLVSAADDFAKSNAQAEQQYQDQRAEIIRDGDQEIERIEADSKDRLRKLEQEHEDRRADIIGRRDALALSKEDSQYITAVSDEKRQAAQEIRDRRQAIAQRLADLQASYEQERAQRLADYQQRVAEIRANAAEQLRELAIEHQAELQRLREQKIAKLKELDSQFIEERKRRYQYFLQQIRDLDATLLGEAKLREQYQTKILTDLDIFLANYRNKLASLGSTTTTTVNPGGRAAGGYASYGMYMLGDAPSGGRGPDEYVMKGITTRAAEQTIGGKLTDQILMAALRGYAGNRQTNYYDQRRMEAPLSRDQRAAYKQGALDALKEVMGT